MQATELYESQVKASFMKIDLTIIRTNNLIETMDESFIKEIKEISDYLNITCSNNPQEIQERISVIMVYMMRTGEMLAYAKKMLRKKKSDEIQNAILAIARENCLSAKVQNALLDSIAEDEAYLVDTLDRLNASCVHQLDALRTLLSYEKEAMRLNKTGY